VGRQAVLLGRNGEFFENMEIGEKERRTEPDWKLGKLGKL
jgi:hypothetical protein